MIGRVLHRFGLATRGEVRALEAKLETARQRLDKTTSRLAEASASSERLQTRRTEDARKFKDRIAELEADAERRARLAKEAAEQASTRIAALEAELRQRDLNRESETRQETAFETQVATAARELAAARDSLVAIEVKLDILEGAANTLDARLRTTKV
jgi:chromosome segregation ATPase